MSTPAATRFAPAAAGLVALLLGVSSLVGLVVPAIHGAEPPAWRAQVTGRDWFGVVLAAPWIAVCGLGARTGSYRWTVLLAGAFAYTVYDLAIYAFAAHVDALFVVHCVTLGLASFALIVLVGDLAPRAVAIDARTRHLAGGFLIVVGVGVAARWLAEGVLTNPVHVIDLAFVLPAHVVAGVLVWRGRPRATAFASVLLAFDVLMSSSIGGMSIAIAIAWVGVAVASATILWRVLLPPRATGAVNRAR